ncbi:hypothetical protein SRRS_12810 [Sporomusa rhizae]|uniref:hypothetical protein n=1 Tax=Sporomusa rhizae TaxID=357999 RepID=UPI00352B5402
MKKTKNIFILTAILLLSGSILLGGCANNLTPVEPQSPPPAVTPPAGQPPAKDVVVTYNYKDAEPVQLSANNITLKVGQRIVLSPAPGLTKTTRFTSSGENFWGDIMKSEVDPQESGQAIFSAIKPGKGKLKVIPNSTDTDHATDLWVTVVE